MKEFILCLAAGFLLLWVAYLKIKLGDLAKRQAELLKQLKFHLEKWTGDVEITTVQRGWGKRAMAEEEDTSWVMRKDASSTKPPMGF